MGDGRTRTTDRNHGSILDGYAEQALIDVTGALSRRIRLSERERARCNADLRRRGLLVPATRPDNSSDNEPPHELTQIGREHVEAIRTRRAAEARGMPLDDWDRRREPWGLDAEHFRLRAVYRVQGGDGKREFHSDTRLLIEGPNPEWTHEAATAALAIEHLLDDANWRSVEIHPLGFCFTPSRALIVFDGPRTLMRADYYEIIREQCGDSLRWHRLQRRNGGDAAHAVRIDRDDRRGVAYIAPYAYTAPMPGIDRPTRARA